MVKGFLARGPLYWLRAPRQYPEVHHDERILALARILLGTGCILAILRSDRAASPEAAQFLLFSFFIYSLILLLILSMRARTAPYVSIGIHLLDVLWAVGLIIAVNWPELSFVLFFSVIVSAAARWGFWETLATGLCACALLVFGCILNGIRLFSILRGSAFPEVLPEELLLCSLVAAMAILAELRALRAQEYAIAQLIHRIRATSGYEEALRTICSAGIHLFGATQILIAIRDRGRSRSFLYRYTNSGPAPGLSGLRDSELQRYFFTAPAISWRVLNRAGRSRQRLQCETLEGARFTRLHGVDIIPEPFLAAHPFQTLLGFSHSEGKVAARGYILDPSPIFAGRAGLHYMRLVGSQVAPLLYDLFLMNRLKTKAEAAAGSRLARDIHDGVIQSLCGINMQLEDLRAHSLNAFVEGTDPLANVLHSLREEITRIRDYTHELRTLEMDSSRLLGYLAGLTMKFRIQHGIEARFIPEIEEVQLPSHVCIEVARIAQEALVNVRKHSQASEVLVRFGRRKGAWVLNVTDNGRGFGFEGMRSHEELEASGAGPATIMERARQIKGKVRIESFENSGASVEIRIPHQEM